MVVGEWGPKAPAPCDHIFGGYMIKSREEYLAARKLGYLKYRDKNREYCKKYYAEHKKYFRERYLNNTEAILAQHKEYKQSEAGRVAQAKSDKKSNKKYPQKRYARSILNIAVSEGKIVRQPCSVCGSTFKVEGHHEDYRKPLEVIWMCRKHHNEVHNSKKGADHGELDKV